MEQTNQFRGNHAERSAGKLQAAQNLKAGGKEYACWNSKRYYQQAKDQFKRANRDLGEVAAFIGAFLATITAVEAVINIAVERIGLSKEILRMAFDGYIAVLIVILVLGTLRFASVMYRRTRAEQQMDQAKKGIYDFCEIGDWSKLEEE